MKNAIMTTKLPNKAAHRLIICIALIPLFSVSCHGKNSYNQLLPVDHSKQDSSFSSFKKDLQNAVRTKDSTLISSSVFKDVQVTFGPDGIGIKAFKEQWIPHNPASRFWKILDQLLNYGCTIDTTGKKRLFICPYTYTNFPKNVDPSNHLVLYDKNIPIFSQPSISSQTITNVDYAILEVLSYKPAGWVKVTGFSPKDTGYIQESNSYTAGDPRIIFEKRTGKWGIAAFVEGD
jgi:hypothetical protein